MKILHQLVNMVANPYAITLLLVMVGAILVRKRGDGKGAAKKVTAGWWVLWVGVGLAIVMGMNPVSEGMAWWLEKEYPPLRVEELPRAEAILVLGGGVSGIPKGSSAPYPNLQEGADRVWHAARIWKAFGKERLKVYCTCPEVSSSTPPFLRDLGVDEGCIVPLDGPWNTEAEAKEYERVIVGVQGERGGKRRVYLVTSAAHMRRAVRIFRKYAPNLEVVPAATDHILVDDPNEKYGWRYWVPNIGAFYRFNSLMHEYLGLVRYSL